MVSHAWGEAPDFAKAIEKFTEGAVRWNKEHFGNIFAKKKNIMARLNAIQKTLSVKSSSFLLNLENDLLKELDTA